jgi:hypothetical protein
MALWKCTGTEKSRSPENLADPPSQQYHQHLGFSPLLRKVVDYDFLTSVINTPKNPAGDRSLRKLGGEGSEGSVAKTRLLFFLLFPLVGAAAAPRTVGPFGKGRGHADECINGRSIISPGSQEQRVFPWRREKLVRACPGVLYVTNELRTLWDASIYLTYSPR